MNKKGYCIGCLRNRSERQHWHTLSNAQKHKIILLLAKRRSRLNDHYLKNQQANPPLSEQLALWEWVKC